MRPIIMNIDKATIRKGYRALVLAGAAVLTCLVAACGSSTTATHTSGAGGECGEPLLSRQIRTASAAFVGRVTDTHGYQGTATVQQVWSGHVPQQVQVVGGPADPPKGVASEAWRGFTVGKRYLFITFIPIHGDTVQVAPCGGARLFKKRLATFAPPDAHPPK